MTDTIAYEKLIIKPEFQKRFNKKVDEPFVLSLVEKIKAGEELAPVWLWDAGKTDYVLIDGFHRAEAYRIAKKPVPYVVKATTEKEAHLKAHEGNNSRKDLSKAERFNAYLDLKKQGYSKVEIEHSLGIDGQRYSGWEAIEMFPPVIEALHKGLHLTNCEYVAKAIRGTKTIKPTDTVLIKTIINNAIDYGTGLKYDTVQGFISNALNRADVRRDIEKNAHAKFKKLKLKLAKKELEHKQNKETVVEIKYRPSMKLTDLKTQLAKVIQAAHDLDALIKRAKKSKPTKTKRN
jgi:hypothetical protein